MDELVDSLVWVQLIFVIEMCASRYYSLRRLIPHHSPSLPSCTRLCERHSHSHNISHRSSVVCVCANGTATHTSSLTFRSSRAHVRMAQPRQRKRVRVHVLKRQCLQAESSVVLLVRFLAGVFLQHDGRRQRYARQRQRS